MSKGLFIFPMQAYKMPSVGIVDGYNVIIHLGVVCMLCAVPFSWRSWPDLSSEADASWISISNSIHAEKINFMMIFF